jgi:hypothetical protein
MVKRIKSRRKLRIVVVLARRCRLHGVELVAIERLGFLADGY